LCCPHSRKMNAYSITPRVAYSQGCSGFGESSLPPDWAGFSAYIDAMTEFSTLTVTDPACAMAHRLLAGADTWLPVPGGYKALTAALLPARLRDAFALRYGAAEREEARQFIAWARRPYSFLPPRLRYVGPYQEAEQRLAGRMQPGSVRPRALAGLTGALTPQQVLQILSEKAAASRAAVEHP